MFTSPEDITTTKVLIPGASGLLGFIIAKELSRECSVTLGINRKSVDIPACGSVFFDTTSMDALERTIKHVRPDVLINCLGFTSVEGCQRDPETAHRTNATIPCWMAKICYEQGVKLIHISTDHLFDGSEEYYTEQSAKKPLNEYGSSKAKGEDMVQIANPNALVVRTNFFGNGPSYRWSFSDVILSALEKSERIGLFDDVYFTPVNAGTLVKVLDDLWSIGASGIFNVSVDRKCSKYHFGHLLCQAFNASPTALVRSSIDDKHDLVLRPKDMSLSNRKLSSLLGRRIGSIEEHVQALRASRKEKVLGVNADDF